MTPLLPTRRRPIPGPATSALVAALTAALGCRGPDGVPASTETDSAGVRIVTSLFPLAEGQLDGNLLLDLGSAGSMDPDPFFQVEAVRFLSGGGFVVANRGTEELRYYGVDGTLLHRTGRDGNGPEEFRGLSWVEPMGDSLLAHDWGNDRISVRDGAGVFVRSFRLAWISGLISPIALVGDRTLLALTVRHMTELEGTGTQLDSGLVTRHELTGELIDSVGRFPWATRVVHREGNRQTTVGLPLIGSADLVRHGDGFCHVFGPHFEVRCFDPRGALSRIVRVDRPPEAVEQDDVERAFEEALTESREAGNDARERALLRARPSMTFPEHFSAFGALISDDRGRLWVGRHPRPGDAHREWWIFEDGRWTARLQSDPSFTLMDVDEGRAIGVWRDDLGVERVQMYRIATDR